MRSKKTLEKYGGNHYGRGLNGSRKRRQKGGEENSAKLIIITNEGIGLFGHLGKLLTYLERNPNITQIEYNVLSTPPRKALPYIKEGEEIFSKLFLPYNENKQINSTIIADEYKYLEYTMNCAYNYYNENRYKLQGLHDVFEKYIKIKPEILDRVEKKYNEIKNGFDILVGIFVRSYALGREQPNGQMPSHDDYMNAVNNLDKSKKIKYFLRIDNDEDLEFYKNSLTPNYYSEIKRSPDNKADGLHMSSNEYMSLQDLEDIFCEVLLLSKCDILLHCVSNMATTSLLINMNQQSICVSKGSLQNNDECIPKPLLQKGGDKTKAHVINLKRRTDRKEKMINKFKNSTFDLEFIEGVETAGNSHRGIGASFKKIVQMAKDNNLPSVLIFEDDTLPEENMDKNWEICKKWLDSNKDKWEVFFGSARTDGHNQTINIVETLENGIKLVNFSYNLTLNWTYLNSSAYDKLLEWNIEKYGPIDKYLGNINYFKNLICYPFLGLQESDVSNSWGSYQNLTSNVKLIKEVFEKAINPQKGGNNLQDITLGILSWKSCKTLQNTLESYKNNGLLDLVNVFIYFQEIGDIEKKLAEKYSVPYIGTPQNIGIQKGLIQMINNTNTKYFIFAENDFELIHNKDEVQKVFEDCIKLLENDDTNIIKLRDIQNPGEPNYSKWTYQSDYKDKENLQDFPYKLEALSYIDSPETVFPGKYTIINYNYKWYKSSSKDNKWSNNIFMAKTQWMKDKIIPLIDLARNNTKNIYIFENNLIENLKDYNLAAGMGLFKHNRLERGDCLIDDIQQGGSYKYESKIHYITVSTEKNDKLQRLLDSAKQFNISIEVLGLEMNTTNLGHNNSAKFGMKLGLPLDYISKLDPNDIVLFTDAWDVIYIKGEKDIIDNYKSFNKPIVFGAEVYCWPDDNKSSEYTDTKDKYFKYLNSGLYIGTAGELRNYLENYKGGEDVDDQRFWTDIYLNNRDKIALDTENKIFLNTAGTDKNDFDFENSIFKFKKTSSSPSVIHSNSSDKTYLDLFIKTGGAVTNKERVFVINLEEKKDRKEDMISKFKDTMFDLEFVDAIKNENGFLGCSLSIQKVIQKAKDENLKTVLFFEDDNKPLDKYQERWIITKEWLDNNLDKWDIFNGGARVRKQYLDGVKLVQSLDKDVNLFQADLILNTNWIYVNSKAYDKILGWKLEDNPSIMCIDHFMGDKNHFTTLFIFPFLGLQEDGETSTEKGLIRDYSQDEIERTNDMNIVLNKLKQSGGTKQKAYVINLLEKTDRKEDMINKFKDTIFDLEFIEAVKNSDGYLGCSLSIQKVVKKAKDENMNTVLWFEDDNKPLDNYEERWIIVKEWLDNNLDKWDIFNGGPYVSADKNEIDKIILKYKLEKNVNLFEAPVLLNTNWMYINKSAYDRILAWERKNDPIFHTCIDNYLGNLSQFKILFIFPFLGLQENYKSSTRVIDINYTEFDIERNKFMQTILDKQKGGSSLTLIFDNTCNWEKDYIINDILKDYNNNILSLTPEEIKSMDLVENCILVFSTNAFTYEEADKVISRLNPKIIIMCSNEEGNHKENVKFANKTKLLLYQYNHKDYNYDNNTLQIPLGYTDIKLNTNLKKPNERKYIWSFIGNQKQDRKIMVDTFKNANLGESYVNNGISKQEMYDIYCDSVFVPNGRGNYTLDCFRLYEAAVAGAIPIVVGNQEEIDITFHYNGSKPPFLYATSWDVVVTKCKDLLNNKSELEDKQSKILEWWKTITDKIQNKVKNVLSIQNGGGNIAYIKKANAMENEYLYPIIKNIFPNKQIEFVTDKDSYDLVLKSHWDDGSNGSNKYIFISPERYDATATYSFNDPNCIAKIFTTEHESLSGIKDSFYLPYFLDNGPFIFDTSPMKREYENNTRNRLAGYVAGYSPEHREKMFQALYNLDETKTTDGLGKANHTIDKNIPPRKRWWELSTVYKDYLFGFAMENRNEDGYITEKIMNVYRGGAIPIYWGTSKVKEIFNRDSFIYVNDYPSYEDCAKDIIAISKDQSRLKKMQNAPIFNDNNKYSKYFDTPSPQWIIDIANKIREKLNLQNGGSVKKILINYTNRGEEIQRKKIKELALSTGNFTSVIEYNPEDIDNDFYIKNKQILDTSRGGGLWLWKPYFILKTLKTMNLNDILFYLDCDMNLIGSIDKYIDYMNGSIMAFQLEDIRLEKQYTKMDLFIKLGCQDNKEITDTAQLDASHILFKKNDDVIKFIEQWLEISQNYHLISDEPSIEKNFTEFIEHRHDQSIFSCLSKLNKDKYNIQIEKSARVYGNNTRIKNLPQLIDGGFDQRSKNKLTVELYGGLGNRLFQIYAGLGFAEKWNMDFYLPNINLQKGNHKPIDESFKEMKILLPNLKVLDENEDTSSYIKLYEEKELVYKEYDNPNNNTILSGFFQNENYFSITKHKLNIPEPLNNLIKDKLTNHLYCIHIRLGDYLGNAWEINLTKYFPHCIEKINTIDPTSSYIVVSDNINAAKEYIDKHCKNALTNKEVIYDESTNRLDSLYYISKSNGAICSNSTFSWFGAYSIENKNKDLIFFPKPWFYKWGKIDIYPSWATIIDIDILNSQSGGNKKKVIHKIIKEVKSYKGEYPKGFGDYLKGTTSLYLLSKELNFDLHLDFDNHPIKNFIVNTYSDNIANVNELFNTSYDELKGYIKSNLDTSDSLHIYTNVTNDIVLDDNDRNILQNMFKPTKELEEYINKIKTDIKLNKKYTILHIRSGDYDMTTDKINTKYKYNTFSSPLSDDSLIKEIEKSLLLFNINNTDEILCISDANKITNYFVEKYNYKTTGSNPIHFGSLDKYNSSLLSTMADFFMMKDATKIYSISVHGWNSGFSSMAAILFNIPIEKKVVNNVKRLNGGKRRTKKKKSNVLNKSKKYKGVF